jgi:hypothetical protein
MSSAVFPKRRETPGNRALPIITYFESDALAAKYFIGVQRFRRILFTQLSANHAEAEKIVLVSNEDLVEQHYNQLRVPNTRVLALTNSRFKDPRNDGVVYAYLPYDVPEPLLERMADNALDHIHLVHTRHEVNQKLAGASREIHELNQIGMALSAEHDPAKLLELILTKSREFTGSDAGSVYLVESTGEGGQRQSLLYPPGEPGTTVSPQAPQEQLRFKLAQNDTVAVPFREVAINPLRAMWR